MRDDVGGGKYAKPFKGIGATDTSDKNAKYEPQVEANGVEGPSIDSQKVRERPQTGKTVEQSGIEPEIFSMSKKDSLHSRNERDPANETPYH